MAELEDSLRQDLEPFAPRRERIDVEVGKLVQHGDAVYRIAQILDFDSIVAIEVESGRARPLRIAELHPFTSESPDGQTTRSDLSMIADKHWQIAQERYSAIKPFVGDIVASREDVAQRASEIGVSAATLYRWLERYRRRGLVTDLVPKKRGWRAGHSRLAPSTEAVVNEVIADVYLTPQRLNATETALEVRRRCHALRIPAPSAVTVRNRIAAIGEKERLSKRGQKDLARRRHHPTPGHFPGSEYPLSTVQIDHTPADIILVDEVHRKPVGRPYLTLAVDTYSSVITGYYLSFDAPSETAVGTCLAHSILPKEEWLLMHGIEGEWPVWGVPNTVHVDNGSEFHSKGFERACLEHRINLEFRPIKRPEYGGHVESAVGTVLKAMHALPGTTFSSVAEKDEYDAEKHASMTLPELEEWLVAFIVTTYHRRIHSSYGMTPARRWEIGIFGNAETQGVGMPPRPADRFTLLLDFLPREDRTVQPNGITIDKLTYYAEALRPWIGAKDADTGKARTFVFRRDPRDISAVWFFDPELGQYFKVPLADQRIPSMSLWEYNQTRERLRREGRESFNEAEFLHSLTEQRERVEKAAARTKKARREAQRRTTRAKKASSATPPPTPTPTREEVLDPLDGLVDEDVEDFGEFGDFA